MLPDWQPARQADAGLARAKADDAVEQLGQRAIEVEQLQLEVHAAQQFAKKQVQLDTPCMLWDAVQRDAQESNGIICAIKIVKRTFLGIAVARLLQVKYTPILGHISGVVLWQA